MPVLAGMVLALFSGASLCQSAGTAPQAAAGQASPASPEPSAAASSQAAQSQSQTPPAAKVTTENTQPSFTVRVQHNEVLVRVVVRDSNGRPVTTLQKDDFQLLDRGKPQMLTHFALETAGTPPAANTAAGGGPGAMPPRPGNATAPAIVLPRRFMALFFDDIHLQFGDLARTRDAAERYLAGNLKPGDRAGIFTSSGQGQVEFTDDRAKLQEALLKLQPRPLSEGSRSECPALKAYHAYQVAILQDPTAIQVAQAQAFLECCSGVTPCALTDTNYLNTIANAIVQDQERDSRYALGVLEQLCRRMGILPGQRSIVLVSPGFFSDTLTYELNEVIDGALRDNVVINSLDARGLYTEIPGGDASQPGAVSPQVSIYWSQIQTQSDQADWSTLASLSGDTGGILFRNNNDFNEGFRRAGAFPEAYYLLAFAPQDLKPDGKFHALKVRLTANASHYTLQARKGYFAPKKNEDAVTVAHEELNEMVFAQEELNAIPIEVHSQFFQTPAGDTRLSVLARVDISHLRFRKAGDRNIDNVTVVTALFNQAGDYVKGEEKNIALKLLDSTLAKLTASGLTVKSDFSVKPGTYLVRNVVQDSEGNQLAAVNSQVEIP